MARKRRQPDEQTGRVWGLPYHYLLVCQAYDGMIVQSRHKKREAAVREGERMTRLSESAVYAVLTLYAAPRQDYLPGDKVNPEDISWLQPGCDDRCSVCCHPFAYGGTPQSLSHQCPIMAGQPTCPQVLSLTIKRTEQHN